MIVVDEKLVFWASFLARGEHGVNEEDGRLENLAAVIDGLPHILGAIVERSHIWNYSQPRLFDCSLGFAHSKGNIICWKVRIIIQFSNFALSGRVCEIRVLTLNAAIVDVGVLTEWVLNTSKLLATIEGATCERSSLH